MSKEAIGFKIKIISKEKMFHDISRNIYYTYTVRT